MNMLDRITAFGLLAAIVFSALAYGAVEPWSVAGLELIILILVPLWVIKMFKDGRIGVAVPAIAFPLFAILLLGLAQGLAIGSSAGTRLSLSMDVEATRSAVAVLFFLTLSFLIAANFFRSPPRVRMMMDFLVIFGFAMAVFALVQHFAWNGRFYWIRPNTVSASPFGPFANHNHFAGYMEMIVPVPVAMIVTRQVTAEKRIFYGFAAAMMCIATLASLSRGGIISLAAGFAFVALVNARLKARSRVTGQRDRTGKAPSRLNRAFPALVRVTVLTAAIAAGVVWVGTDPLMHRVTQSLSSGSQSFSATRAWIWSDTLSMIRANWVLGVGLGAYGTVFPTYSKSDGAVTVPQSHNDYLQIVADCGIIGGAIAIWFIVLLLKSVFRAIDSRDRILSGLALGVGGGIFAILVHSLFDFNLQIPSNALLFLVLVAVASQIESLAARDGTGTRKQAGSVEPTATLQSFSRGVPL